MIALEKLIRALKDNGAVFMTVEQAALEFSERPAA
jgi:peptidoglycan/xylan/chitin deacetylase (PgdA/CDA1 family)